MGLNRISNIMRERASLSLSPTDLVICLWYVYVLASALTYTAFPCFHTVISATYMLSLYLILRVVFSLLQMKSHYIIIGVVAFALFELGYGIMQLANGSSNHYLYPMTGTFLNPGPYAASLAIGLVVLCQYRKEIKNDHIIYRGVRLGDVLTAFIMTFMIILPSTWSRAALLSACICLGITYWKMVKRWKWWIAGVCLLLLIALYFFKSGSANGRFAINYISALCVANNPLIGNGIGSFFHCYAEKTAELSTTGLPFNSNAIDVLDYAFNDFMLVAVEQGLAGLTFAILLTGFTVCPLWRISRSLAMGMLSLLIFSLFSYPFELLPYQIIMVVMIAYSANGCKKKVLHTNIIIILAVALLLAYLPWRQLTDKQEAEKQFKMMYGMTDKAFIDDYYSLLPMLEDNRDFLFDFGKSLRNVCRYNDSNAMLRKGTLISNDPMFYILIGNNYKDMGYLQLAEKNYWKAYHIMPNRMYPLYQLMLLYEQNGDKMKMKRMAKRIMETQPKIKSPATDEMKEKASKTVERF